MINKSRVYARWVRFWMLFFVCISAFFYAPAQVFAEGNDLLEPVYAEDLETQIAPLSVDSASLNIQSGYYCNFNIYDTAFDFAPYLNDGAGLYEVTFDITSNFTSSAGTPWWFALNTYFNVSGSHYQASVSSSGAYKQTYSHTAHGKKVYVKSDDTSMSVSYKGVMVWNTGQTGLGSNVVVTGSYSITNVSVTKVTAADSSDYEDGYNAGYSDGEEAGYNSGYSTGFNSGYTDGKESIDTDSYYQAGYTDGFNAGKESINADQYYQDGYDAGYAAAYDEGYQTGYDEAYNLGYSAAYEEFKSSSVSAGGSKTVTKSINISNSSLDIEDVNTTLPLVYDYEYDFDYVTESSMTDHDIWFVDNGDTTGSIYTDDVAFSNTDYIFSLYTNDYMYASGYYLDGVHGLFTASTDAYAYKVTVKMSGTSFSTSDVWKAYHIVGTQSDVMSGEADLGLKFYSSNTGEHSFFIKTDNLPLPIFGGVLFQFFDSDETSASYDLKSTLTVTYTPYTRSDYSKIVAGIDNVGNKVDQVGGKIDSLGNKLTNGYSNSTGTAANSNLRGSVDEYGSMEGTLFDSVSSGLSDFQFFDFESVPAMITGLSFIGAIMQSWFVAAGGASGVGIVLSVLFSVMLVSMALGLYRLYQSASHRNNRKGG